MEIFTEFPINAGDGKNTKRKPVFDNQFTRINIASVAVSIKRELVHRRRHNTNVEKYNTFVKLSYSIPYISKRSIS